MRRSEVSSDKIVAAMMRGDRVTFRDSRGCERLGVVMIPSGTHAALSTGGSFGIPAVVTPENLVSCGAALARLCGPERRTK